MSMDFVYFGWILLLITTSAVELSIWIGVRGCLCPNSLRIIRMHAASLAAINREPSSALASNEIKFLMICEMTSMAPLFGGDVVFFDKKKIPLARLSEYS